MSEHPDGAQAGEVAAVQATGLGKRFGETWAVRGLELWVRRGEVYGILGPNGAGKTTTLRMMAGLLVPSEGEVLISGRSPGAAPMDVRRSLGFLTGDTRLYDRLTPRELLSFFGRLHELPPKLRRSRVDLMVEQLGLGEFERRPCGTLSTGQKQRVNIARALLHDPEVLVMDEPTAGLDIISADFILQWIRQCRDDGRGVIFSTHILAETELICDRVGILYKGRLVREGRTPELIAAAGATTLAEAFKRIVTDSGAPREQETADPSTQPRPAEDGADPGDMR